MRFAIIAVHGCCFSVLRVLGAAPMGGYGMNARGLSGPGRILLVEDDPITARFTSHVLSNRGGFEVSHAAEPAQALTMVKDEAWDLVLTDVEMPGMTGIEVLEQLRRTS